LSDCQYISVRFWPYFIQRTKGRLTVLTEFYFFNQFPLQVYFWTQYSVWIPRLNSQSDAVV